MEFRILGPLEVVENGASLPLGGPRQRALLTLLLLHADESVSTERLLDDLWGADSPASGATAVQNQIARLRKVLGPDRVQTRHAGYAIRVEPDELDLDRFLHLVAAAAQEQPEQRSTLLAEAIGLWRGAALSSLPDAPFVAPESSRLDGLRLAALEDRIDADLELGRHADLVAELSALAARYPLQERLRGQLMLALYRSGRQAEALDVYRETRRMLADELGLDPSQSLRDLERRVLEQDPSLDPPARLVKRPVPGVVSEGRSGRRPTRRAATVALALCVLGAAGAFAAYALDREPRTENAARTSGSSTPTPTTSSPTVTAGKSQHENAGTSTTKHPATTTLPPATTATAPPPPTPRPSDMSTTTDTPVAVTTAPKPPPTTTSPEARTTPRVKTTATPKPKTKPTLLRIEDDFSAPTVDAAIWHVSVDGTGADVTEQGGQIAVAIAADGLPGGPENAVGARIGTRCTFPGDFDARVAFTLFEWSTGDNVSAGLNAFFADGFVGRRSSSVSGDQYVARVGSHDATVQLDETAGVLRLARVGTTLTAYFWRNGHWVPLTSGSSSGAAVLGFHVTAGDDFAHQATRIAFDNFAVSAPSAFCPPGSAPPGA